MISVTCVMIIGRVITPPASLCNISYRNYHIDFRNIDILRYLCHRNRHSYLEASVRKKLKG
jgi:hypothetical protein